MEFSYSSFIKKDLSTNLKPVYLLFGKEEKLKEEIIDKLTSEVLSRETKEYNISVIDEGKIKEENINIIFLLNSMPFMANRRVVIIKEAEKLDKKEEEKLILYLKNPSPYTLLILVISDNRKMKGMLSSSLETLIKKTGVFIDCSFSYERERGEEEMKTWVNNKIKSFGKKIEPSALEEFVHLTRGDLFSLSNELDKVISFLGERDLITKQDVETVIIPNTTITIFKLVDAIGEKNYDKALDYLIILLREGERPERILGMISRQFRLIFQVKTLSRRGYISEKYPIIKPDEIQTMQMLLPEGKESIVKQPPFVINKCLNQAKMFTEGEICRALNRILEADLSLKGIKGATDDKLTLELLILDLCQK